jgi:hypothetical protein
MKFSRATAVGLVATAALLSGGAAYAATASTPTASTADTIATKTTGTFLGTTGGAWTTVETLNLPPGKFVLHASGDFVNFGPSDYTRCVIVVAGAHTAGVSAMVGNPSLSGARGPATLLAPFALVGGTINATSTIELAALQCEHDTSNSANPYVDGDVSFWAHKTGGLTLANE